MVYCRPFASKAVLIERFWKILSSPFTVPNNRRTREESLFWKGSSAGAIFSQKTASLRFQTSQQKGRKSHAKISPHLPIKNPSKRSGASPHRKLKSHSFWTVKMHSKIHTCQPETAANLPLFDWMSLTMNAYQVFLKSCAVII